MDKNTQTFIGCDNSYQESKIVIFGAPFDGTTSYRPGTRFASAAIRNESYGIETYSPYQDRDLLDYPIFDGGDLELPFGDTQKVLKKISAFTDKVICDEKIPFMIGGEHLVTLGSVESVLRHYPDLHIIHFDAHADLRDEYLGVTLSHASVMRRCYDLVGDNKIYQFGIRSGDREEFIWGKGRVATYKFGFDHLDEVVEKLYDKPVYFTLDLDVLDPSIFPGTGTPEAGGVTFQELLKGIGRVFDLHIVALDMNELSPIYDSTGTSTAVACKILREMLLHLSERT